MEKASEVLKAMPRDKWTQRAYYKDGKYCAIGWLWHTLGWESDKSDFNVLGVKIRKVYGITDFACGMILSKNDSEGLDAVIEFLNARGL